MVGVTDDTSQSVNAIQHEYNGSLHISRGVLLRFTNLTRACRTDNFLMKLSVSILL